MKAQNVTSKLSLTLLLSVNPEVAWGEELSCKEFQRKYDESLWDRHLCVKRDSKKAVKQYKENLDMKVLSLADDSSSEAIELYYKTVDEVNLLNRLNEFSELKDLDIFEIEAALSGALLLKEYPELHAFAVLISS